ncbi:M10 family metallopeptidase C-terminal domain-containing protein [Pseudoprimorskyibacter insulae]|uniref:Serralysin C n=1 Tax=Pseudoprimorskyibacter insulae TaxID=1695997 RepID=A0A2R8AVB6_9RHOB|nr:M10 family metallopeptidase C-terminal domain-containing protein [Pseudoprimorskyibacter insulae]SPF79829.1 Serralysin C [Pseudoprimorskyibacter insulae]
MCFVCCDQIVPSFCPVETDPAAVALLSASLGDHAQINENGDALGSASTTHSMSVGDTFNGTLNQRALDGSFDVDFISFTASAGQTITVTFTNSPGLISTARLVDGNLWPTRTPFNTDSKGNAIPGGTNSFTVTFDDPGTFYLRVTDEGRTTDATSRDYSITLSNGIALPVWTTAQISDYLQRGYWQESEREERSWNQTVVTVDTSAMVNTSDATGNVIAIVDDARRAMALWNDVMGNLTLTEVSNSGDITLTHETGDSANAQAETKLAPSNFQADEIIESGVMNVRTGYIIQVVGGAGNTLSGTYVHEFGHLLGLGHAGPYDGAALYGVNNNHRNDIRLNTIMSYMDPSENTSLNLSPNSRIGGVFSYTVLTPMLADIAAVQEKYGVNTTTRTGNDTYGFNTTLPGTVYDTTLWTRPVALTLYDRGGIDTLDMSGFSADQVINLSELSASSIQGGKSNLYIASGTVIENATGGSGNDVITGNDARNALIGGAGDDTIHAVGANDQLEGGTGNDKLYASGSNGNWLGGDAGDDTLYGGFGQDYLFGGEGEDSISGQEGADQISGGAGRDSINGGSHNDTIHGDDGADTIHGGSGNDSIAGDSGADLLNGNDGDDTLNGGNDSDTLNGHDGNDKLIIGEGNDRAYGGTGNDLILVDAIDGVDMLFGEEGDDTISLYNSGTSGGSDLDGGDGSDVLEVLGDWSTPTDINLYLARLNSIEAIRFGGTGTGTVSLALHNEGLADVDTLIGRNTPGLVEHLKITLGYTANRLIMSDWTLIDWGNQGEVIEVVGSYSGDLVHGSDGNDSLTMNDGDDSVDSGDGDDFVIGGTGKDFIMTGNGDDVVDGGADNDLVATGSGQDIVNGGDGDDNLAGGDGDDVVAGGAGNDTLNGGKGVDVVSGEDGDDVLTALLSEGTWDGDFFFGGDGVDTLRLTGGVNYGTMDMRGAFVSEIEVLEFTNRAGTNAKFDSEAFSGTGLLLDFAFANGVQIRGAFGNAIDTLTIYMNRNAVDLSALTFDNWEDGTDKVVVIGNASRETITGTSMADRIDGLGGNDKIDGGDGNDSLLGGDGADTLIGGAGRDTLLGGAGDDRIMRGTGALTTKAIDGGDGTDMLDLSDLTFTNLTVDLDAQTLTTGPNSFGFSLIEKFFSIEAVEGTANDDSLMAAVNGSRLSGGDGNDTLIGRDGNDTIYGGLGNDMILGVDGVDQLFGGGGDDTLSIGGGGIGEAINGGGGIDLATFSQSFSAHKINLSSQSMHRVGAVGGVPITFEIGTIEQVENVTGSLGNDTITGDEQSNVLNGALGDDILNGKAGNDTLIGGLGSDTAQFDSALNDVLIFMRSGQLAVNFGGHTNIVEDDIEFLQFSDQTLAYSDALGMGNTIAPKILGTAKAGEVLTINVDSIEAAGGKGPFGYQWMRDGSPVIGSTTPSYQLGQDDLGHTISVTVGFSNAAGQPQTASSQPTDPVVTDALTLIGTAAADTLTGSAGHDSIDGLAGDDLLNGGLGNDTIIGGNGKDTIIGGGGNDSITGGADGFDLRDVIYGGDGDDTIDGGYGNDELRGDDGNDNLAGGFGADTVLGGKGDDVLTGAAFGDVLFGGDGSDFINGGFGYDRVNGGGGADKFYHLGNAGHGSDWIQDFNGAEDILMYGGKASGKDFLVQKAFTPFAGSPDVPELFITHIPTGNLLWALVDGAVNEQLIVTSGAEKFDLMM